MTSASMSSIGTQTSALSDSSISFDPVLLHGENGQLEDFIRSIVVPPNSPKAVFQNWGQSFVGRPVRVFAPTTVAQCAAIVELARRDNVQLRAVGRAHSPSDLALTKGWAVRMEGVKGIVSIDAATPSVTALGGTYISDVHEALDAAQPRLAIRNVGSISEQTIAGLISTATHGTGIDFPVVSAYVDRLSILCPLPNGTQHILCSRQEHPELFNATLCGLGSTGLITSVTLQVQHAFNLKQYSEELSFDSLFGAKTGYPATVDGQTDQLHASIGKLLSQNRKLPECPEHYRPSFRSQAVTEIYPIPPSAHVIADKMSRTDPQDDDETRQAQTELERAVSSAQHVRMMWFPQVSRITMLRANRSTEAASPAPSLASRIKGSLLGHRLTEFLLYASRFNTQWTPTAVRWIHYLTHPAFPDLSSQAAEPSRIETSTEPASTVPPSRASRATASAESTRQDLKDEIAEISPDSGRVGWMTEDLSAAPSQLNAGTRSSTFDRSSQQKLKDEIAEISPDSSRSGEDMSAAPSQLNTGTRASTIGRSSQQDLKDEIAEISPDSSRVGWMTEDLSAATSQLKTALSKSTAPPPDSPAPRPLKAGNPVWSQVGRSDHIFNMDCLFVQYTDEWAIPFSRAAAAIRAMRDWLDEEEMASDGERIHFPVEIRFADADGIWLSHAQGRKTCYIGIVQYRPYNRPVKYRQLFAKFEALMRHFSGRPHWAKAHSCSPIELSRLYPHWDDFLITRQKYDPDQIFVNPYVERHLLGKVGERVDSRVFKSRL